MLQKEFTQSSYYSAAYKALRRFEEVVMKGHKREVAQPSTQVQTHEDLPRFPLRLPLWVKKAGKIFPSKAVFPES